MRKGLLFTFAMAAALGASAALPMERSAGATNGAVKQITAKERVHAMRAAAPQKALGEAPANTVEVPFTHGLGKDGLADIKNLYTAINANGDNRQWQYGSVSGYAACMVPNAADIDNNDDWLITVPIHMPAGDYVVSFEVGIMGSGAIAVEFDAWLFSEPTLNGKLAEIAPTTRHTAKDMTPYEFNCAIPEEGYYYIGVHCTTAKADKGTMKLANLGVRAGSVTPPVVADPPVAGTLTYELAPKGELKATLTYTAPTKTQSGADLEAISKVLLTSRWEVDKYEFTDVQPGQTIVQEVEMYKGFNNRFTAVAYVGETAGEKVEIKNIYCGPDTPLAPTDVKLTLSDDYTQATMTWTAPGEVGENGGYVDVDKLTYYIFDAFGTYYDPALASTTETSFTFDYSGAEGQDFYAYQVTAGVDDYYSLDEVSNIVVAGTPDKMPYGESFAEGYFQKVWMYSLASTGSNTMTCGTITDDYFASLFGPDDTDAPADNLIEIPQDQGKTLDDFARTAFEAGDEYNTYTATADLQIAFKMLNVDVADCDYILIKYAEPVAAGWHLAFWTGQDLVALPAGSTEYKFELTDDMKASGVIPQITMMTFFGGYTAPLEAKVVGIYKHSTLEPETPALLASQDGDNGFYYWLPFDKSAVLGLSSLRADISGAANPALQFWYQGQGSLIETFIAPGTADFELAQSIDLKENPTTGWTLATVPLAAYKEQGAVTFEIRLSAIHNDDDHTWSVPLDNICVRDLVPADLHIVTASLPAKVAPGQTVVCSVHIENCGTEAAATATAKLTVNGAVVETKPLAEMAAYGFADVEFEYTVPLNAPETLEIAIVANIDGEATPDDNEAKATATVARPAFATVTDLAATVEGTEVTLTWTAPVNDGGSTETVFEDFENEEYTPMTISGPGEWTVYDGDGVKTYNVFREGYNPYQTAPMAFQLFNREVADVSVYYDDAEPHSGNSFMMAPSAQSAQNDNWLISPALSGNAQTVTFWAKSCMIAWPETMEVYYSTTDNQVESFTAKVEFSGTLIDGVLPEVWTLYTVELPEGAKYFAIHHNTDDTLALMIDDVTYEAASQIPDDLAIVGYYIYRDGMLIASDVKETTYTDDPLDTNAADGDYHFEYTVVPVYNHGSVLESNAASVDLTYTGIDEVAIDSLDDATVIYNLSGMRVAKANLTQGVYILVTPTTARKAYLR